MRTFQVTAIATEKAPAEWPFVSVAMVIIARDTEWAEKIAEETIGLMELQRGAYNSIRIDEVTEINSPVVM